MSIFTPQEVLEQEAAILAGLAAVIEPAPELTISEWADGRVIIPGETGTDREGPLSWVGFEYLREPLDRLGPDDPARDVVFKGSAQIAKTTAGVVATLYYSSVMPRSWGVALPSNDEVLKYNRSKWQPLVDATPELRRKIRPVSSRDEQGSTNTYKRFAGGYGQFFGAGSPKALQMVTYCLVVYEETPNWSREVGGRGDPRSQIRKRQLRWELAGAKTFHNATPGLKRRKERDEDTDADEDLGFEGCPVTEDFDKSDQRRLYHPCPHCGDMADGTWLRLDYDRMQGLGAGDRPHFNCPDCSGEIEHRHKAEMVRRGTWLPTYPSKDPANPSPDWHVKASDVERWRNRPLEGRQPGYHAWQIVSSAVDWHYIAEEHRTAETGTEQVKIAFSQQILGEAYELVVQQTEVAELLTRRDAGLKKGVVPAGAEILTGAVDLNGDWAQWSVYGWGPGGEHWLVDRGKIEGAPADTELWAEMAELIGQSYPHAEGGRLKVETWGIDSGYGTFHVYAFCNRYARVKALDGAHGWGLMPLRRSPGKMQALQGPDGTVVRCRTWRVGTWDLKRTLLNEAIPAGLEGDPATKAAGKSHWPIWVGRDYFDELTAEALIEVQDKKTGVVKHEAWVKVRRRNEEMDLWVYNAALARSLGVGVQGAEPDWLELARRRGGGQLSLDDLWNRPTAKPAAGEPGSPPPKPPPQAPAPGGNSWFSSRKRL